MCIRDRYITGYTSGVIKSSSSLSVYLGQPSDKESICDHGLRVRLAEEQDVKRLLAIYYRQDLTTEVFRDFDGEEYMAHG